MTNVLQFAGGKSLRGVPVVFVCVALVVPSMSCCGRPDVSSIEERSYLGYQPIDPFPADSVLVYDTCLRTLITYPWADLPCNITKTSLLPLQTALVSMRKTEESGKISYLASAVSGESGSYIVVMDFMKYRVEYLENEDHTLLGSAWVGVGLRLNASIETKKSKLNLSGIGALGLEASKGNLSGNITVNIIGIDSKDVTNLIPLTSKIDETSIQSSLEALASIKSKIWEGTQLTPHYVAIVPARVGLSMEMRSRVANFAVSASGDCLRQFWKPDGKNIDSLHQSEIVNWMKDKKLDTGPGSITMFLYGEEYNSLRNEAVLEMNVECK